MANDTKKKKSGLWMTILCIALVGCICCAGYVGWYLYQQYRGQDAYDDLKNNVVSSEQGNDAESETEEFDGWIDGDEPVLPENAKTEKANNPINFAALEEINPEIYAWVQIPNTKIDYPVAQNAQNGFYLTHNLYKEYQFAGCIYTEEANKTDFSDPVTVMYGHNMRNGSMFQNLHLFEDADFFKDNQYVYVYTPGHKLTYEIFAAYEMDNRHILNSFDFSKKEEFQEYIDDALTGKATIKHVREGVKVNTEDKVLTLSTCMGGRPNTRFLVQAVLTDDEETK